MLSSLFLIPYHYHYFILFYFSHFRSPVFSSFSTPSFKLSSCCFFFHLPPSPPPSTSYLKLSYLFFFLFASLCYVFFLLIFFEFFASFFVVVVFFRFFLLVLFSSSPSSSSLSSFLSFLLPPRFVLAQSSTPFLSFWILYSGSLISLHGVRFLFLYGVSDLNSKVPWLADALFFFLDPSPHGFQSPLCLSGAVSGSLYFDRQASHPRFDQRV